MKTRILTAASIAICIVAILQTARDRSRSPGGDLRNRVAGARRMASDIDPYLIPSVELPDFYRTFSPITVSPAHLLLYMPLRAWPYLRQRQIYFWIDWLLVGGIGFAILRLPRAFVSTGLALFLLATLLVGDRALRLHFDRGQAYLLLLFLSSVFALSFTYSAHESSARWSPAFVLGVLILLRPTYLLVLAGCAILGRVRTTIRALVFTLLLLTASLLFTGVRPWPSYVAMMGAAEQQHFQISVQHHMDGPSAPGIIEGLDFRKHLLVNGYEHDRTFLGVFGFRGLATWSIQHQRAIALANRVGLLLSAASGLLLLVRLRSVSDLRIQATALLLLPLNVETFGPQRYAYADILLVLPLMLLIFVTAERFRGVIDRYLMVAAVFAMLTSHISVGPVGAISVFRYMGMLLAADIAIVWLARQQNSEAPMKIEASVESSFSNYY